MQSSYPSSNKINSLLSNEEKHKQRKCCILLKQVCITTGINRYLKKKNKSMFVANSMVSQSL